MVKSDTIEGVVDDILWYHYDLINDVLYLQLAADRDAATYSEESQAGFLIVKRQDNDRAVGMTVVSWWKRFGQGALPDSLHQIEQLIEHWAKKVAA